MDSIKRPVYILLSLAVFLSIEGCKHKKDKLLNVTETSLSAKQYTIDERELMHYPFRVRLKDSTVFIMDLHGAEAFIQSFSFPALRWNKSIGQPGNGPHEMLDCENIRFDSAKRLWLMDANKMSMSIHSNDTLIEVALDRELVRPLDFCLINDSLIVMPDYTGRQRFVYVNSKGRIVSQIGQIPDKKTKKKRANMVLAQAWRSFIDYNPTNGILALATQLGEVVEIWDSKNNVRLGVFIGEEGFPVFRDRNGTAIPDGIMGYSDIQVGRNVVYALFWGHTFRDLKKGVILQEGGKRLDVFNLKGERIHIIHLDRNITGFEIDEASGTMLALDPNSNQPLVSYSIPKGLLP